MYGKKRSSALYSLTFLTHPLQLLTTQSWPRLVMSNKSLRPFRMHLTTDVTGSRWTETAVYGSKTVVFLLQYELVFNALSHGFVS